MTEPDIQSIRLAMDLAWRDHHHARDQTWKAVSMEAVLAAGLVGVDLQIGHVVATLAAGLLVLLATAFGVLISLHHRRLEIQKFTHILNCEKALGLIRDDLIPPRSVKVPRPLRLVDAFSFKERNTAAFILRMHIALMMFTALYMLARIFL